MKCTKCNEENVTEAVICEGCGVNMNGAVVRAQKFFADLKNPVFDGPQPLKPHNLKLNAEADE